MRRFITKSKPLKSKEQRILEGLLVAGFWLAVWQSFAFFMNNSFLMVSPFAVVKRLFELGVTTHFWQTVAVSLGRILAGYGIGVAVGVLLGICGAAVPFIQRLLAPLLAVMRATPVTSFVILALVWIKSYNLSIFVSFLMVFPMLYTATLKGIQQVDHELLEVAYIYRFSFWKTVRLCYFPAMKPLLIAALSNAIGFGWKAGVAGEVLAQPRIGIGSELQDAKIYLETLDVFCWTAVTIFLSILVETVVLTLMKKRTEGFK